jgi:replicative DNA helicase
MNADGLTEVAGTEAERVLLGSLLLDNRQWDKVSDRLRLEHFHDGLSRQIFAEVSRQLNAGQNCDIFTVHDAMRDRVSLADLNAMAQPGAGYVGRYADIVLERHQARELLETSAEIASMVRDSSTPIESRLEQAQALLMKLTPTAERDEWVSAYDGMVAHSQVLEDRASGKLSAWPTHLPDLDEYLEGGLVPGNLVIVGARPSMGKTALGMTIGVQMAQDRGVGMLSLEMSHSEVRDRLVAMLGHVSLSMVKRPSRGLEWDRVVDGTERAKALNFHVSDQGALTLNQVRSKARNLKRLHGIDVLIVDYIGLMTSANPKESRNNQLGEISRGLKTLAKELQISVLCLAQLNRKAEERADQMPQMSDLRDSGEIEQDADVILFIKRPVMANPELGPEWQYYAKLSVAKNRQGRCGYIDLSYIGEQTRFAGWSGAAPQKPSTQSQRGGGL